jgi:NAD(P)H-dependent FMN reductase
MTSHNSRRQEGHVTRIVAIAGSLRQASYNAALVRAATEVAPAQVQIEVASIRDIPLYDAELEASGMPDAVDRLKERVATADGLLLASPEYNNSIPGVFKNAIDWMSRPPNDIPRVFGDRPVALIGATPGAGGTLLAQAAWLPVFRTLKMRPWFGGRLGLSRAGELFDASGKLTDDKVRADLTRFLAGFAEFIARGR